MMKTAVFVAKRNGSLDSLGRQIHAKQGISLPHPKVSSQVIVGDKGCYRLRWPLEEEIVAAFGFPTRSPFSESGSGVSTLPISFLPLPLRRTVLVGFQV